MRISLTLALFVATTPLFGQSSPAAANSQGKDILLALTYSPQRAIVTGSGAGFWLQGGAVDAAFPLGHQFSIAANLTAGEAGQTSASGAGLSLAAIVAGPRYTFNLPRTGRTRSSFFFESLFGVAHGFDSVFPGAGASVSSSSSFALLAGGGYDLALSPHLGLRVIEADCTRSTLPNGASNQQNNLRLAIGIAFRLSSSRSHR